MATSCINLVALPASIGYLSNLQELLLSGCYRLRGLPITVMGLAESLLKLELRDCQTIQHLPHQFQFLRKLSHLDLGGCFGIATFPVVINHLVNMTELVLGASRLTAIPEGFGDSLGRLKKVDLSGSTQLTSLPDSLWLHPADVVLDWKSWLLPYLFGYQRPYCRSSKRTLHPLLG